MLGWKLIPLGTLSFDHLFFHTFEIFLLLLILQVRDLYIVLHSEFRGIHSTNLPASFFKH